MTAAWSWPVLQICEMKVWYLCSDARVTAGSEPFLRRSVVALLCVKAFMQMRLSRTTQLPKFMSRKTEETPKADSKPKEGQSCAPYSGSSHRRTSTPVRKTTMSSSDWSACRRPPMGSRYGSR